MKELKFKIGDKIICVAQKGLEGDMVNYALELIVGQEYVVLDSRRAGCFGYGAETIQVSNSGYVHDAENFQHAA